MGGADERKGGGMSTVTQLRPDAGFYSIEAEQQLLGALILADGLVPVAMRMGGADLFCDPVHAEIYSLIEGKYNSGELVSPVTLKAALDGSGLLDGHGGHGYLPRLAGAAIFTDRKSVQGLANTLGEYAQKRAIQDAITEAQSCLVRGDMAAREIATKLEGALIAQEMAGQTVRPVSMLAAVNDALGQAAQAYHGSAEGVVQFGIPSLDSIIPGLYPGELVLLGGRPSMGKSALALTMALNVARAGHGVAIASLEMTPAAMAQRALSEATANAGRAVPYINMRRGDMTEDQFRAVVEEGQHVGQLPITFLPRGYSDVEALVAGVRQIARASGNLKLLIVDYAQLLKAAGRDRYQQVTAISMALKGLAMSLDIPVLALSQLSRGIESRDDKRPMLSDLRESGQLEQDADSVLFCYRDEYYLEREEPDSDDLDAHADWRMAMDKARNRLEIIVAKQRMGSIGTARVMFAPPTGMIWEDER